MMSGLPSALRVNAWKIAPEMPSAAPISSANSMRGIRHSRTTTRSNEVLVPVRTRDHVAGCDGVLAESDGQHGDDGGGDEQRRAPR